MKCAFLMARGDVFYVCLITSVFALAKELKDAACLCDQRVGLAIPRSRVRVPLWPLAGFVLGRPELKSSATLENSQLVASLPAGFLTLHVHLNFKFVSFSLKSPRRGEHNKVFIIITSVPNR